VIYRCTSLLYYDKSMVARSLISALTWVDLLIAYSKRLDLLFDLVSAMERLRDDDARESDGARSVRSGHAPRVWRVSDRLDSTDVQRLISGYRGGVTVHELAEQFKISMSSVKRRWSLVVIATRLDLGPSRGLTSSY
jgi:hypothetical protein